MSEETYDNTLDVAAATTRPSSSSQRRRWSPLRRFRAMGTTKQLAVAEDEGEDDDGVAPEFEPRSPNTSSLLAGSHSQLLSSSVPPELTCPSCVVGRTGSTLDATPLAARRSAAFHAARVYPLSRRIAERIVFAEDRNATDEPWYEETQTLQFSQDFESGNLQRVAQVSPFEYDLELRPDHKRGNVQWFNFSLSRVPSPGTYTLNIVNLTKPSSLYNAGLRPCVYSRRCRSWISGGDACCHFPNRSAVFFESSRDAHVLSFRLTFDDSPARTNCGGETRSPSPTASFSSVGSSETARSLPWAADDVYCVAQCYPFSYSDLGSYLQSLQSSVENRARMGPKRRWMSLPSSNAGPSSSSAAATTAMPFSRWSKSNASQFSASPGLSRGSSFSANPTPSFFTAAPGSSVPVGPLVMKRKVLCQTCLGRDLEVVKLYRWKECPRYIVIMSRVHPGETCASWVLKGVLDYLVSATSQPVLQLTTEYKFVIFPMVNPDGVALGHARTDSNGCDLNRQWRTPSAELHPTIFAAKHYIRKLQSKPGKEVVLVLDLHGHSQKTDIFMFGNDIKERASKCKPAHCRGISHYEKILPFLFSQTFPRFSYSSCTFHVAAQKEGTARVVAWEELNVPLVYTIETSFARRLDEGDAAIGRGGRPDGDSCVPFSLLEFQDIGVRLVDVIQAFLFSSREALQKVGLAVMRSLRGGSVIEPGVVAVDPGQNDAGRARAPPSSTPSAPTVSAQRRVLAVESSAARVVRRDVSASLTSHGSGPPSSGVSRWREDPENLPSDDGDDVVDDIDEGNRATREEKTLVCAPVPARGGWRGVARTSSSTRLASGIVGVVPLVSGVRLVSDTDSTLGAARCLEAFQQQRQCDARLLGSGASGSGSYFTAGSPATSPQLGSGQTRDQGSGLTATGSLSPGRPLTIRDRLAAIMIPPLGLSLDNADSAVTPPGAAIAVATTASTATAATPLVAPLVALTARDVPRRPGAVATGGGFRSSAMLIRAGRATESTNARMSMSARDSVAGSSCAALNGLSSSSPGSSVATEGRIVGSGASSVIAALIGGAPQISLRRRTKSVVIPNQQPSLAITAGRTPASRTAIAMRQNSVAPAAIAAKRPA